MGSDADDVALMRAAIGLGRRGLGTVAPNPSVGCVIVDSERRIAGRGWTQPGGRPHGETEALLRAGDRARGATAYVSLEPCNHYGKTPPCTEAIVAAGIRRVVVACEDPDPRVSGNGIRGLREAGLSVDVGICADEARDVNAGFMLRISDGRPLVTLKLATTLDGRIATRAGRSRWITGEAARAWGHGLRATHDAIMIGINTALADDPELTCRLPGLHHRSPVRIVVDSRLRLSLASRLVRQARTTPTWVLTLPGNDRLRVQAFVDCGICVIEIPPDENGTIDVARACRALGSRGMTRVLVEGGARLAASMLRDGLVDRIEWFRAPGIIGGDGIPAVAGFGVEDLQDAVGFVRTGIRQAGHDLVESYARRP
ncbi:MAG TPA: bifunctional diaminohydroxyphosphoribosylaminopyrimidine deaminase/5-amino-6-(5-phosphoribosylamino)uracil reductase RibD [Arenibaculum sp.]|nr:bifunctional diaminohydroxyphosphoribosylaminopyrimidine deaminase/5-amino-6-(5-phosphoribosylamino)uracil reductase RibD [Arenibaculum sp.]